MKNIEKLKDSKNANECVGNDNRCDNSNNWEANRGSNPGHPAASPLRKEVLAHRTVQCIQSVFKQ